MRCIIITKKHLYLTALATLILTVAIICSSVAFASADRMLPIYNVQTDKKQIAISFDAAWGNDDTETLINILKEYDVPATFFVVGAWVDKYPESVKQLHDAGHKIGNHSDTHPNMPNLSAEEIETELKNCNEKIKNVTGEDVTVFRCPYGAYNNTVLSVTEKLGMYTIQWDVETLATKVIM